MPAEEIVFSPSVDERQLDRETDQVNDHLAEVGRDVPVSFDAEELGGVTPAGGGGGSGAASVRNVQLAQLEVLDDIKDELEKQGVSAAGEGGGGGGGGLLGFGIGRALGGGTLGSALGGLGGTGALLGAGAGITGLNQALRDLRESETPEDQGLAQLQEVLELQQRGTPGRDASPAELGTPMGALQVQRGAMAEAGDALGKAAEDVLTDIDLPEIGTPGEPAWLRDLPTIGEPGWVGDLATIDIEAPPWADDLIRTLQNQGDDGGDGDGRDQQQEGTDLPQTRQFVGPTRGGGQGAERNRVTVDSPQVDVRPQIGRVLVQGLGGGSIQQELAAEITPDVIEAVRREFGI